jgi:hypothetical protein
MDENIDFTESFITLHTPDGEPLLIRKEFLAAALCSSDERKYTKVLVEQKNTTTTHEVKEDIKDIIGPFAHCNGLLLNPKYIAWIGKNKNPNEKYKNQIDLHVSSGNGYVTDQSVESLLEKLNKAERLNLK